MSAELSGCVDVTWPTTQSVVYWLVLSWAETKRISKRRIALHLRKAVIRLVALLGLLAVALAATGNGQSGTIKGYVIDSACTFTKNLKRPVSPQCAVACAKAGSPLVILSDDGTIYWPIDDAVPSSSQNSKLLPFAGQKVTATGKIFERGGSHALVIDNIEPLPSSK
jgi:hypothetical protein